MQRTRERNPRFIVIARKGEVVALDNDTTGSYAHTYRVGSISRATWAITAGVWFPSASTQQRFLRYIDAHRP